MIQLKDYQHRVLDSLREFLSQCARTHDPEKAFEALTTKVYGRSLDYVQMRDPRFAHMPYVCVRVPTGGGKTLLARSGRRAAPVAACSSCLRGWTGAPLQRRYEVDE